MTGPSAGGVVRPHPPEHWAGYELCAGVGLPLNALGVGRRQRLTHLCRGRQQQQRWRPQWWQQRVMVCFCCFCCCPCAACGWKLTAGPEGVCRCALRPQLLLAPSAAHLGAPPHSQWSSSSSCNPPPHPHTCLQQQGSRAAKTEGWMAEPGTMLQECLQPQLAWQGFPARAACTCCATHCHSNT